MTDAPGGGSATDRLRQWLAWPGGAVWLGEGPNPGIILRADVKEVLAELAALRLQVSERDDYIAVLRLQVEAALGAQEIAEGKGIPHDEAMRLLRERVTASHPPGNPAPYSATALGSSPPAETAGGRDG